LLSWQVSHQAHQQPQQHQSQRQLWQNQKTAGLGRAESEIAGQLAARKGRRGRASTVLGAADETAGGMTASKRLLGE
jgi:hypothetical protein